jgi:hypothetical protein
MSYDKSTGLRPRVFSWCALVSFQELSHKASFQELSEKDFVQELSVKDLGKGTASDVPPAHKERGL